MAKVYRLEHRITRFGVYNDASSREVILNDEFGDTLVNWPLPQNDALFVKNSKMDQWDIGTSRFNGLWRFGFDSLSQLFKWFNNEQLLLEIAKRNVVLRVYDCFDVIVGNSQVMFSSNYHFVANIIDTLEIKDILANKDGTN